MLVSLPYMAAIPSYPTQSEKIMQDSKNLRQPDVETRADKRKQRKQQLEAKPVVKPVKTEEDYQNLAYFIIHGRVKD